MEGAAMLKALLSQDLDLASWVMEPRAAAVLLKP